MSQVDGLLIDIDGVLSVSWVATAAHLRRHHPGAKCLLLNSGDLSEDMGGASTSWTMPTTVSWTWW